MKKMNKKGFTLVEMLVVIAIIAILVSILIPTVLGATKKAKAATNAANLRSAVAEFEIKSLTAGSITDGTFTATTCDNEDVEALGEGEVWFTDVAGKSVDGEECDGITIVVDNGKVDAYYDDDTHNIAWYSYYAENGKAPSTSGT